MKTKRKKPEESPLPEWFDAKPEPKKLFDIVLGDRSAVSYKIRVEAKDRMDAVKVVKELVTWMQSSSAEWGLIITNPPATGLVMHGLKFVPDRISPIDVSEVKE